jgi:outer membrane protein assembly factor BamB
MPLPDLLLRAACLVAFLSGSAHALAEDWPRFRGPTGQGISSEKGVPLSWSATDGVAWKAEVPGEGWSSPIVVAGRVYLTTATEAGVSCRVLAFDTPDGKLLWDTEVFRQVPGHKNPKNSHATPTPVGDGERVYAVFADGGIAAVDTAGKLVWTNRDFKHYSHHGLGASPLLFRDLLVMPFDGSSSGEDKELGWKKPWDQAVIAALDRATGKVRWRARRGLSRLAHVTPNVLEEDGKFQLVSAAGDVVQGFDPETGDLVWTVKSQGEGVVPSIVVGDGLVFTSSGFEASTIRAIRTGGKGDVTETHVAWSETTGVPRIPSFLYRKPYLYAITESGIASCFEAATGKVVWRERVGGNHSASPVWAEGRIYFLSEEGEATVIRDGDRFEVLARNPLGERCQASPAISGARIYIRTDKHLFAIAGSEG